MFGCYLPKFSLCLYIVKATFFLTGLDQCLNDSYRLAILRQALCEIKLKLNLKLN